MEAAGSSIRGGPSAVTLRSASIDLRHARTTWRFLCGMGFWLERWHGAFHRQRPKPGPMWTPELQRRPWASGMIVGKGCDGSDARSSFRNWTKSGWRLKLAFRLLKRRSQFHGDWFESMPACCQKSWRPCIEARLWEMNPATLEIEPNHRPDLLFYLRRDISPKYPKVVTELSVCELGED
jgi:hypothetical protein